MANGCQCSFPLFAEGILQVRLTSINHDRNGFEQLVDLYKGTQECFFDEIEIDLGSTGWIDADMCAPLGAILYKLGDNLNTIRLENIQGPVASILAKNGFLSSYGGAKIPDTWGTTIHYQKFDTKDDRYFASYIEQELMNRKELPQMSIGLLKKFRESVFEVFSNAVVHSETKEGIFSCGQFFPRSNTINFSVADLGIGIRKNVKDKAGIDLQAHEAINWATLDGNTTKRGPIPGGLGLKLLRDFVRLNGGKIQIVSDAGYWCLEGSGVMASPLNSPFPGTVVSLEINTKDRKSYVLSSEISPNEIF